MIVNADDFGLTDGVNQAILELSRKGHVTSTSVMVNHLMHQNLKVPGNLSELIGLGIHLNLTSGAPILPPEDITTLVGSDGNFSSVEAIFENTSTYNLMQIEKEWRAQIISFVIKFGRPDHLDSHHHVHLLPRIFALFITLAGELQIPVRMPITPDLIPEVEELGDFKGLGNRITSEMLAEDIKIIQYSGVRFPDYFMENFLPAVNEKTELLRKTISNFPVGTTELMCHPAYVDDNLRQISHYAEERDVERKSLEHKEFYKLLSDYGIDLVRYNKI